MDDIIQEFICETQEKLDLLDQELIKLEQIPLDSGVIDNIFRMVHTIKGTSGFIGLDRLGSLAHAAENVLGAIREERLTPNSHIVDSILQALDRIKEVVAYLGIHLEEPDLDPSELISHLNRFLESSTDEDENDSNANTPSDNEGHIPLVDEIPTLKVNLEDEHHQPISVAPETVQTKHKNAPSKPTQESVETEEKKASQVQSIRVNLDVLEKLMQVVSELVLNRNQLLQLMRTHTNVQDIFQSPLQQLSYITSEIQERMMKTRMQPIGNGWSPLVRIIRNLSQELGKKIELKTFGEETELDRQLLEMIKDPLTHMIRNSCDHGIEKPEDRIAAGKSEVGTIKLSSYHEGGHIVIKIEDDGRGINIDKIKNKVIENQIVTPQALENLSHQQIMQFIFHAGFSTAESVTSVSGRGVGMDVVRTNIEKMGGAIELFSEEGRGSKFLIKIPLTLAIISVLIVETNQQKFAFPQINVQEVISVSSQTEYCIENLDHSKVLRLRGSILPLVSLSEILGLPESNRASQDIHIVICRVGNQEFGLIVDQVHDTEEIVVKPVTYLMKDFSLFSGNTILGDGSVIMILDPGGIAKNISSTPIPEKGSYENHNQKTTKMEQKVGFLLFRNSSPVLKAIPLELVSRIETANVTQIVNSAEGLTLQYREELMRVLPSDHDFQMPSEGEVGIVVFVCNSKHVGLLIQETVDITYAPYGLKVFSDNPRYLGSMIIEGETTDIIDVANIFDGLIQKPTVYQSAAEEADTPKRILLVEDSPLFRNLTVNFLTSQDFDVTTAEDGLNALNILLRNPHSVDCVITDIEMPRMNGYEFLAECRNTPDLIHLPIIAYTGFMEKMSATEMEKLGFNHCISKSDRWELLKVLCQQTKLEEPLEEVEFIDYADATLKANEQKTLVTKINNQYFSIPVDHVRDVLKNYHLAPLPHVSPYIKSFMNLRGRVVTILNLDTLFNYEIADNEGSMLVVIEYKGEYFGIRVDDVDDVLTIDRNLLEPVPLNLSEQWSELISGVYQCESKLLAMMDIDTCFEKLV